MYAATTNGTSDGLRREPATMTPTSPNVATASLSTCGSPLRTCVDQVRKGVPNMACARSTPATAPVIWAAMIDTILVVHRGLRTDATSVTSGLKWAPDTGPNVTMSATNAAPVAI